MKLIPASLMMLVLMVVSVRGREPNGDVISYIQMVEEKVDGVEKQVETMEGRLKKEIEHQVKQGHRGWKLQAENVCFGARDNTFGKLMLKDQGSILALKLVHRSGSMRVDPRIPFTNWGGSQALLVFVTDKYNQKIFPKHTITDPSWGPDQQKCDYYLPGFDSKSKELVFTDYSTPAYGRIGQELRLWNTEDLHDWTEHDNVGKACVDVYVMFDSY